MMIPPAPSPANHKPAFPYFALLPILATLLVSVSARALAQPVVPDWAEDAIWYQIFPERFANGDTSNDPPGVEKWGGKPEPRNFFGGDLQGIIDHLDYLQRLGVNALYLNPIFESPSNHKYHTSDYLKIDHNFGDDAVFQRLVGECHRRGMHIIIDGVFNHTGVHFFAFEDIKKNEAKSPYLKWYDVHSFPVGPPEKPNYEAWWGLGDLPKLMTGNPEVRKYLFDATTHWMKAGLDGWRLDVPNEIPHEFWIEWRKLVKAENPEAYIVGEIWDDATPWLQGDQFDAVMNYRFRGGCVGFIALGNQTATQFDSTLTAQRNAYPGRVDYVLQNLIGSHDTERFMTLSGGDAEKVKLAVLAQMTYVGAPMIYYGDEIGMQGGKDPDCRHTMEWDSTKWNLDLWTWYQKLVKIRNDHRLFRRGSYKTVLADDAGKLIGYAREDGSERALVFLNNGSRDAKAPLTGVRLPPDGWRNLLTGTRIPPADSVVVPARSGVILFSSSAE
ncbi:MAG TPA: glycoside hydrolase family 13 protein [Bacteroidota bacterium]